MSDKPLDFGLSAIQRAKNLLDKGLDDFIGDGITIEIATRELPSAYPREPLGALGKLGGWKEWKQILPIATALAESNRERDSAKKSVRLAGIAGSKERQVALQKWYATMTEDNSPFDIGDTSLADMLATVLGSEGLDRLLRHLARIDADAAQADAAQAARLAAARTLPPKNSPPNISPPNL
jgi:hypothetical protein